MKMMMYPGRLLWRKPSSPASASATGLVAVALFILASSSTSNACTVFIVGKDATTDGSVLVTHSNDGEFDTDPRLVKVPAQDHDDGASMRPVFFSPESYPRYVGQDRGVPEYSPQENQQQKPFKPIGFIPQVPHTFAYLEDTYGAVNEHQVGIGESTCSGVFGAVPLGAPNGTALLSVDALTQIAMERATTARQVVELMGQLAEQYGFYGAGEFEGTSESLGVTDPNEAWIFHILPDPTGKSAIWAAQKIPSNSFAVLANMFVLRELDPNDKDNFLMSDSVHSVAQDYGWWHPTDGTLLDFTKVYSDGEYAHKFYSGRRMWGGFHLACESQQYPSDYKDLQSDPVYPLYCTPDHKISSADLFRYHRYTYQNTAFDLGAEGNLAAGPFGSPDRWKAGPGEAAVGGNWERPIGLYRTSDTYVVASHADWNLGAVLWFGPASALATVFTPFIVALADVPASFRSGHHAEFSRASAFWAACVAHNVANLKWNYAIQDVTKRQNELEGASIRMVRAQEQDYQKNHNLTAAQEAYDQNIQAIVTSLWSLSDEILFKYASGFVNEPGTDKGMSQMVGYPAWWLKEVGFAQGPPPPPTKPKCCHPPKQDDHHTSNHETMEEGPALLTGKAAMKNYLRNFDDSVA
ncbi:Probable dipeptidase A [Seminavis robusta]|uniref:Probable dipeptidase A n=1 Tax=Seminavis robusta TaxID=568900 RepID=A0A9N8D741_9STRA|nr:Probable dipeptidase A [Seminavis robusta]|eukprot:Sro24_g016610.1 Probable dipeptidase A (636) ;mRNA; f:153908-155815